MILRSLIFSALAVAPLAVTAQDASCDQFWTVYQNAPTKKADRPEGISDEVYRYIVGADAFATAFYTVKDSDAAAFAALDKTSQMVTAIGLKVGDALMTCYRDDAAADPVQAEFVTTTETAFPPTDRTEIVGTFRMRD